MKGINSLRLIVAFSLASVAVLTCFSIFYISPSYTDLIIKNAETEAVEVGRHLAGPLRRYDAVDRQLPDNFIDSATNAIDDFGLEKIKVFSPAGEIVYSSDHGDIGTFNKYGYFHNIVAKGNVYTKLVKKDSMTLEGRVASRDVVETYVPIMHGNTFAGAFELYFDITKIKKDLNILLFNSNSLLALIAVGLILPILVVSFMASKFLQQQKVAEKKIIQQNLTLQETNEKLETTNSKLQKALAEIKTLQGIIPICMYCKKIRSDKGVWDQLEVYLEEHSEADFSHGCCPECYEEQLKKMKKKA
ncbi:MAG: hypothetical protein JRF02_06020 [Deltaproteobacteria bacterium]|jgi:hypothetical protein|nr:hypothetical protein [Deltaproteobacteria bacterium]